MIAASRLTARWLLWLILPGILIVSSCGGGSATTTPPPAKLPPTISKAFGSAGVNLGGNTTLTFTLTNPNSSASLSGIGFTDNFPSGLAVSTPNGLTGSCGSGTITATAGATSASLAGASLGASASCMFAVNVTGDALGAQNNVTSAVTS